MNSSCNNDKDNNNNINNNNANIVDFKEICNTILEKEIIWWSNSINENQIKKLTDQGYNVENLLFFAELTFTINGIKPVTLISEFQDVEINKSFIENVILSSSLLDIIGYYQIGSLSTSNCTFKDCLIIYNKCQMTENVCKFIQFIESNTKNGEINLHLTEIQLSELLDYPFPLAENINEQQTDEDNEQMMDIGYQTYGNNKIITSYFCTFSQLKTNRSKIESHFSKYNNLFQTIFSTNLKLKVMFT